MTLLAYNPADGVVCVDSLHSWNDGLTMEGTKIVKTGLYIGSYAGSTGGNVLIEKAITLIDKNESFEEVSETTSRAINGCEAILRKLDYAASEAGSVFFASCHKGMLTIERLSTTFIATGVGAAYMRAYMAEHQDFYKAFELAKTHSTGCGGETERF